MNDLFGFPVVRENGVPANQKIIKPGIIFGDMSAYITPCVITCNEYFYRALSWAALNQKSVQIPGVMDEPFYIDEFRFSVSEDGREYRITFKPTKTPNVVEGFSPHGEKK